MASSQQNDTHAIFQAVSHHPLTEYSNPRGMFVKWQRKNFISDFFWFSTVRIILLMFSTLISLICHRLNIVSAIYVFLQGATVPGGSGNPYFRGFTIKLRHITVGLTSPD